MNLTELRSKHPVFHYQSFDISETKEQLDISFDFLLEPDIRFRPRLQIPLIEQINTEEIRPLVFNLGLVEAISYWKAACPPVFSVEAGLLNEDQISWWHDLFIHGLGEFYYRNNIEFTKKDFLIINYDSNGISHPGLDPGSSIKSMDSGSKAGMTNLKGDLILVGGGKDSIVTLEVTKNLADRRQVMLLNPNPAMFNVSKLAGFPNPIIIKRTIDPKLLELNGKGYLNGHTPFSAYLAFLSLLIAKVYNFQNVLASNEQSASVGNISFHNLEINHQYSKSLRFEKMFREYCQKYFSSSSSHSRAGGNPVLNLAKTGSPIGVGDDDVLPEYFSFLRPLSELQIAMLFSKFPQYFPVLNSCNVGRGKYWCGKCPKCAFVYLILSPFIPTEKLIKLFYKDLLDDKALTRIFLDLVGLDGFKPFDCVGTKEESCEAVSLTLAKYKKEGRELPKNLTILKEKLKISGPVNTEIIRKNLKAHWNSHNFLPEEYNKVLRNSLTK